MRDEVGTHFITSLKKMFENIVEGIEEFEN